MMASEPELGQMLFGAPTGEYGTSELGDACVKHVLAEIDRVFWNRNQKKWDRYEDPKIPGVTFRPYYWGDDEPEAALPNLTIDGSPVEIRWYKYPMRGGSVNLDLTPDAWQEWLNLSIRTIQKADTING